MIGRCLTIVVILHMIRLTQ